jgi:hypothetical protein
MAKYCWNQGRERNAIENVAKESKTNWYCPPKEKQLGKTRTAALAYIEIKELNRCTN